MKLRSVIPSRQELTSKYNRMFFDYLVNCCCRHELGVSYLSNFGFNSIAQEVAKNWEYIDHHHKHLVVLEKLKVSSSGVYIKFPVGVRQVAGKLAMGIPGGPLYKQTFAYIHHYCSEMMDKQTNQEYNEQPLAIASEDKHINDEIVSYHI